MNPILSALPAALRLSASCPGYVLDARVTRSWRCGLTCLRWIMARVDASSARYMIRINGHLGATLLSAFPAMAWQRQGPETVLTGVLDRPGLYGLLAEIEALGLDLLEIRQVTEGRSPERGDTCSP
jgi:hypothetical protein